MSKKRLVSLVVIEMLVCFAGLAVSLVPMLVYSDPFWGVEGFVDKDIFESGNPPGIVVRQLSSESPAALAGLRMGDRVISVNGKEVQFETFRYQMRKIRSGARVAFDVKRGEQMLKLEYQTESPTLDGIVLLDWQFVSAPIFLAFFVLCLATQPLDPPPLWRAILVTHAGMSVMTVAVVFELTHGIPWTPIWRSRTLSTPPPPFLHYSLTALALALGFALAILGALDIRAVLTRKRSTDAVPNAPGGH
jgi:hypothetical protein